MNRRLELLQPYPFERLRGLLAGVTPPASRPIRLSIGEPQHPTPEIIRHALATHLDELASYPLTAGMAALREAIAAWFGRRYRLRRLDAATEVLPVNGSREALFAFAQAIVDAHGSTPVVISPNPFYQIYEGAALLAGAEPLYLNQVAASGYALNLDDLPSSAWERAQLLYVCSPGNPSGHVMTLDAWRQVFQYADRYGLVVASDECYSEIYPDDQQPPLGGLEAAQQLGREAYERLAVFTSLSKRSNAPGLRSGAVAGNRDLLRRFLLYRTYHGSAMSPAVQHASIAAWADETHVTANRTQYRAKFNAVMPILAPVLDVYQPDAGFYLWARVPGNDDESFTRELFEQKHVTVLPGRYLSRHAHGVNPGRGYVRVALVPELADCVEAAERIAAFCRS